MMVSKVVFLFIIILMFFFMIDTVISFTGVSPGSYDVNFKPGEIFEDTFVFNFKSSNNEASFDMEVEGDLAKYVTLSSDKLESPGEFSLVLKLPLEIEKPGPHRIFIIAYPVFVDDGRNQLIKIRSAVKGLINVYVPYPGKYADLNLKVEDANAGDDVKYTLDIFSRGKDSIITNSRIEVVDIKNITVETFDIGNDAILSQESVTISSKLNTKEIGAGSYRAIAYSIYDGKVAEVEDNFRLGSLNVKILNYSRELDREKINSIFVKVQSGWNDPINNLFAEMTILETNETIKTPSVDLLPWAVKVIKSHFDTTSLEELEIDKFNVRIILNYHGKTTEEIVVIRLKNDEFDYKLWGGIVIGVLITILFLYLVIVKIYNLGKKSGKKE